MFERTRFSVPIVAAVASTIATGAGMILATNGYGVLGPILWLLMGPTLMSIAFWSLRAALLGRWSISSVIPALACIAAFLALTSAFWVAVLRDQVAVEVPSVMSFWALGLLFVTFMGVAVAVAATPSIIRGGARRDWAITAGFFAGFVGAVPLAFMLLSGIAPLLAGAGLTGWAIRAARQRPRLGTQHA